MTGSDINVCVMPTFSLKNKADYYYNVIASSTHTLPKYLERMTDRGVSCHR